MARDATFESRRALTLVSVTAILSMPAVLLAEPEFRPSRSPVVPEVLCTGPDCPEGEGFLGDAPAHMAPIAEADLGVSQCSDCGPVAPERPSVADEQEREAPGPQPGPVIGQPVGGNVARLIEDARDHCATYIIHWRVDCLGSQLRAVAEGLSPRGDAGRLRAELIKAADELSAIAAANAYAAQPPVRRTVEVNGRRVTTARPIRSIAAARLPAANTAAEAVLDTLSTTLLRSAPSAAASAANFERAAQAVDSAKILLRSA